MWIVPSTSSRSVPATASEISRSDWRFLALERECTWREKPMPARLWHARWKTAHWLRAVVSGLTSEPSMPDPSLEPWIASWRPTPAKLSVTPGSDSASPIPGTSGPRFAKLSEPSSLPWFSSKTLEDICAGDSKTSQEIFDQWASALRRDCILRRRWAHRTVASDSLPWPTPTGRDFRNPERSAAGMTRKADGGWTVDLNTAAHLWDQPGFPVPKDAENSGVPSTTSTPSNAIALPSRNGTATPTKRNWQSPQARDHRDGRIEPETAAKHCGSRPLNEEVLELAVAGSNGCGERSAGYYYDWRDAFGDQPDGRDPELAAPAYFPPHRTGDWARWNDVLVRAPWLRPALASEEAEHLLRRVADGLAAQLEFRRYRVDRIRCVGNGICPASMAVAFCLLCEAHGIGRIEPDGFVLSEEFYGK